MEEKLKLDLKIQELQFSLEKEWAEREATLHDEIHKLKNLLVKDKQLDNNQPNTANNKEMEGGSAGHGARAPQYKRMCM